MLTLTRAINILNNALVTQKTQIKIKYLNNLTINVFFQLQKLNYIDSFIVNTSFTTCDIYLNPQPNLTDHHLSCVSTSHRFVYFTYSELQKLRSKDLTNDYLISTEHKIMNIDAAIRHRIGGLVLLKLQY